MQAQDIQTLGEVLRTKIAAMPGVAITDRSRYYTIQKGDLVLGWVTPGARRLRVDFPDKANPRKVGETMFVSDTKEIPAAIKRLRATKKVK